MSNDDNGLYIVATPIGNMSDISERAIKALETCNFIICENPKHSLKLLNKFGIKKKLISMHDHNEELIIQKLSTKLKSEKIVLISDAGSPLISDPGFKLIRHCIKNEVKVSSIPGPTSIIPALQLSGLSINKFCFAGFFPKTNGNINEFIDKINKSEVTSVFFVSPHKITRCLEILSVKFQDRLISISKELTKFNEKTIRCKGSDLRKFASIDKKTKGEFVIVVEGNSSKQKEELNIKDYSKEVEKLLLKFSLTDVVQIVHKLTGINKNRVYKWVLNFKKSKN